MLDDKDRRRISRDGRGGIKSKKPTFTPQSSVTAGAGYGELLGPGSPSAGAGSDNGGSILQRGPSRRTAATPLIIPVSRAEFSC